MEDNKGLKILITVPQEYVAEFYASGLVGVIPHCDIKILPAKLKEKEDEQPPKPAPTITAQALKEKKLIKLKCHCGCINHAVSVRNNGKYAVTCKQCNATHYFYDYELERVEYACSCGDTLTEYMPNNANFKVFDYEMCRRCHKKLYLHYDETRGEYHN